MKKNYYIIFMYKRTGWIADLTPTYQGATVTSDKGINNGKDLNNMIELIEKKTKKNILIVNIIPLPI